MQGLMNSFKNISYSFTHNGQRSRNEDYCITDDLNGIYVLADGMGGYKGGEVACRIAATVCHDYIKSHLDGQVDADDLIGFIRMKLKDAIQTYPEFASMGTTLCCLFMQDGYVHAIHIGDSKIIIITDILYESMDHTYAQLLINHRMLKVDEYHHHPMRNILTRCLTANTQEKFKAEYQIIPMQKGCNTFFLCSDGVLEAISPKETIQLLTVEPDIHKILLSVEQNTLKYSQDNSTAIIVGSNYSATGN